MKAVELVERLLVEDLPSECSYIVPLAKKFGQPLNWQTNMLSNEWDVTYNTGKFTIDDIKSYLASIATLLDTYTLTRYTRKYFTVHVRSGT